jgi:hypothetical protein
MGIHEFSFGQGLSTATHYDVVGSHSSLSAGGKAIGRNKLIWEKAFFVRTYIYVYFKGFWRFQMIWEKAFFVRTYIYVYFKGFWRSQMIWEKAFFVRTYIYVYFKGFGVSKIFVLKLVESLFCSSQNAPVPVFVFGTDAENNSFSQLRSEKTILK